VFGESQEPGTGVAHPDPSECCTTLSFIRLGQWAATTVPTANSSTPQEVRTAFLPGSVWPPRALGAGASFRMSAQIIFVFNWLDPIGRSESEARAEAHSAARHWYDTDAWRDFRWRIANPEIRATVQV